MHPAGHGPGGPIVSRWARPVPGGWQLVTAYRRGWRYVERLEGGVLTARAALAALRTPRS